MAGVTVAISFWLPSGPGAGARARSVNGEGTGGGECIYMYFIEFY